MQNTKNISKITIDYTPYYPDGSVLTITPTSISCEYKDKGFRSFDWSYQSNSHEFKCIFEKIIELAKKHLEPTPEKEQADQYEILITYDDNIDFSITHTTSYIMFEDLFSEIHKLIPPLEEIPMGFDTEETAEKRIEDLDGDYKEPVRFEDTEGNAID